MKARVPAVYAAVGLAGWAGAAWWETIVPRTDRSQNSPAPAHVMESSPTGPAAAAALMAIRHPGTGTVELSRIAALMAATPDYNAALRQVETWPPGAAREFALAMFEERLAAEREDPETADDTVYPNRFQGLTESLAKGEISPNRAKNREEHRSSSADTQFLGEWLSFDPAGATAAVLKMPPGPGRTEAVDLAVTVVAKTDPAAAMELFLQSGEQHPGPAAAGAWADLIIKEGVPDPGQRVLERMTPAQRDVLLGNLSQMVHDQRFDDSNTNSQELSAGSDATLLASTVLLAGKSSPGLEQFFTVLAASCPLAAEEIRKSIQFNPNPSPAHTAALEILYAGQAEKLVAAGDLSGALRAFTNQLPGAPDRFAVLDRTALTLLPALARSGELPAALELLNHIPNPHTRRYTLEAILPSWMDKDPAAARAALDAAPLTNLEREAWERHPSFLLNPAPKP